MEVKLPKRKTQTIKSFVPAKDADLLFKKLKNESQWKESIRSVKGFTRLGCSFNVGDDSDLDAIVARAIKEFSVGDDFQVRHIYLNYYKNGEYWTPNHRHKHSHQIVISLGCDRSFHMYGKHHSVMQNGDAIIFGTSLHGIPQEDCDGERISIALFLKYVKGAG